MVILLRHFFHVFKVIKYIYHSQTLRVKKLKETEITCDFCQIQTEVHSSEVKDKLVLLKFAITLSNNLIVHKYLQFF